MKQIENTLSSLEVAEMVGKAHNMVLRDIRRIIEQLAESKNALSEYFVESKYEDTTGRNLPCYLLTKKGCELFSTRMTGAKGTQFAVAYIERFNQMELHIKQEAQLPTDPMEILKLTFQAQENTVKEVEKVKDRVTDLEENTPLSPGDYGFLSRRINQRVNEISRSYGGVTREQRSKLYIDINQGVKAVTGTQTRTQLRAKHYDIALAFINDWEPSTATKMQIRQTSLEFGAE
ncbi:Rha family transcriptional regulator [Lactococcus muris]|uniref:Rha family transcriptional regulator n=1 Tax=Lactococcus muris TaxID=2941330 RepID=A0ABV4D9F5_9LACT